MRAQHLTTIFASCRSTAGRKATNMLLCQRRPVARDYIWGWTCLHEWYSAMAGWVVSEVGFHCLAMFMFTFAEHTAFFWAAQHGDTSSQAQWWHCEHSQGWAPPLLLAGCVMQGSCLVRSPKDSMLVLQVSPFVEWVCTVLLIHPAGGCACVRVCLRCEYPTQRHCPVIYAKCIVCVGTCARVCVCVRVHVPKHTARGNEQHVLAPACTNLTLDSNIL
jgi:hypothetical protein|mmetsp:Transcript_71454/g.119634  ORF Transcript_71454/g.119634 Transcript_71454/m.119634 type:complete len:218 (+) Transcript_71454:1961-2614(+)